MDTRSSASCAIRARNESTFPCTFCSGVSGEAMPSGGVKRWRAHHPAGPQRRRMALAAANSQQTTPSPAGNDVPESPRPVRGCGGQGAQQGATLRACPPSDAPAGQPRVRGHVCAGGERGGCGSRSRAAPGPPPHLPASGPGACAGLMAPKNIAKLEHREDQATSRCTLQRSSGKPTIPAFRTHSLF